MKSRINFIAAAILIMLGAIIWILIRGQKMPVALVAAPAPTVQIQLPAPAPPTAPPLVQVPPSATPTRAITGPAVSNIIKPDEAKSIGYTAANGDTLSNLATGLLGSDSKPNRDAVVAANPSLQDNPDLVLAGTTYYLTLQYEARIAPSSQAQPTNPPATRPEASVQEYPDTNRVLTYTAQPGDNVSALAAGLLGGDSKKNRDAIIDKNSSLQNDPDKLVAGKIYKIPTKTGLSAATAPSVDPVLISNGQPNDDDQIHMNGARELRYIAIAGDNVSKLATILLGSDTQDNRDAIINSNPSLKSDPDRVVAGQTYWIPAPAAPNE